MVCACLELSSVATAETEADGGQFRHEGERKLLHRGQRLEEADRDADEQRHGQYGQRGDHRDPKRAARHIENLSFGHPRTPRLN